MNRSLAILLSCLAIVVAGCGGNDDEADGGSAQNSEQQQPDTSSDTGAAASAGTVRVGMKDIQYVPREVKVKAGGTVKWTNSDSVPHTVTREGGPGPKFDSGNMDVGATFEQKFDSPGKFDYVCTIHPNQTGTVTVE